MKQTLYHCLFNSTSVTSLAHNCNSPSFNMSTPTSNENNSVLDHSPQCRLQGIRNAFCSSLPLPSRVAYFMVPWLKGILDFVSSQFFPINTFFCKKLTEIFKSMIENSDMHCPPGLINSDQFISSQQVALLQPSALLWFLGIRFYVDKMQIISPSMRCCIWCIHCNPKPTETVVYSTGRIYVLIYLGIPNLWNQY